MAATGDLGLLQLLLVLGVTVGTANTAETELLLDTAHDFSGNWKNWQVNRKEGWYQSNSGLANGMVYSVCQVELDEALEFWLRSPYIDCLDARSVSVELRFTTRSCAKHPRPGGLKRCKETLDLMAMHSSGSPEDARLATNMSGAFFTKAHTVAPDVKWERNPTPDQMHKTINTKVFQIEVQRKGLYIALRDTGSCVSLLQVRVFFLACPRIVSNFTIFERTPAPPSLNGDLRTVRGQCVRNAELTGGPEPSRICKSNGEWFSVHNSGVCLCGPGFFAQGSGSCDPCPPNSYKPAAGHGTCVKCPENSQAAASGSRHCECKSGYFRNPKLDSLEDACSKPPSAPRDAIVSENSRSRVVLSWSPPESPGGRTDIRYHVDCYGCAGGPEIQYEPGQSLTERSVVIRGLQPLTRYTFHVYAMNGVSEAAGAERQAWRAVTVQTSASLPGKLDAVSAKIMSPTSVRLSWERGDPSVEEFELKVFPKSDHSRPQFHFTRKEEFVISNLERGATYLVQIRGRTSLGWGEYSDAIAVNTLTPPTRQTLGSGRTDGATPTSESSSTTGASVNIIIGAVVAVLLCLVIVLTMIILMSKRGFLRRSKMKTEKQTADCSGMLPYSNNLSNTMTYGVRTPFPLGYQLPVHHLQQQQQQQQQQLLRSYVDPHTYEDPGQAVQEFAKEIDASWITIDCVLGGGEFGDVCKGVLTVPGRQPQAVAIKTLKPGASDKNKLDFLTEASIMGQFDDANVIFLEGVVTRSHPAMIVTEFMANGSLDTFLRSHDGELSSYQLVGMLRGIASGMRYLSDMGYIHRDLAARNILVSEQLVCKVADFGLSREIPVLDPASAAAAATGGDGMGGGSGGGSGGGGGGGGSKEGTYTTRGGKIPIRWTAPEAIHFRKFTSATDVWSFGIVMWEVMSFGERPYWNWSNQDVIAAVENGYRLPPPMDCPEAVHQMMLDCWKWERAERPKFVQLVKVLDRLLRQPDLLASQRPRPIYEPPSMSMPARRYATVTQWLASVKMERFADTFHRCGISSMELVPQLTGGDLSAMGIEAGNQRKLLHAIENLKMHIYEVASFSDGYMV